MNALCLTAWNRPELLARLLQCLREQDDIEAWTLIAQIEPSKRLDEILNIFKTKAPKCSINIQINRERLGVRLNPLACIQRAASMGAENFVLIEDDLELSKDALQFCHLALNQPSFSEHYCCGNLHFSSCFNKAHLSQSESEKLEFKNIALETFFLSSMGLFFTQKQFVSFIQPHWMDAPLKLRNFNGKQVSGWDCALNQALLLQAKPSLQSLSPRVRHAGIEGIHSDAKFHQESYAHAGLYSGKNIDFLEIFNTQMINKPCFSRQSESWGHLLRLAEQLWSLQRYQVKHALTLSDIQDNLKSQLLPHF